MGTPHRQDPGRARERGPTTLPRRSCARLWWTTPRAAYTCAGPRVHVDRRGEEKGAEPAPRFSRATRPRSKIGCRSARHAESYGLTGRRARRRWARLRRTARRRATRNPPAGGHGFESDSCTPRDNGGAARMHVTKRPFERKLAASDGLVAAVRDCVVVDYRAHAAMAKQRLGRPHTRGREGCVSGGLTTVG